MASIPTLYNGRAEYKNIGLISKYEKTEDIYIYDLKLFTSEIKAKYIIDYDSSVWIHNPIKYEIFAQKYAVRAGGWYGADKGGRWNTIKRTFGEILFLEVEQYNILNSSSTSSGSMLLSKNRLSNNIIVEIRSEEKEMHKFICNNIKFFPSFRILLLDRKTEKFIDKTEILDSNGLGLIEDLFNEA